MANRGSGSAQHTNRNQTCDGEIAVEDHKIIVCGKGIHCGRIW